MLERAKVLSVGEKGTEIEFRKTSACESCRKCAFGVGGTVTFTVENYPEAQAGDTVVVETAEKSAVSSLLLFGIPLAALIIGFAAGYFIFGSELIGLGVGLILFMNAFIWVFFADKWLGKKKSFLPVIKELYKEQNEEETMEK